jgi:hypothetical protein
LTKALDCGFGPNPEQDGCQKRFETGVAHSFTWGVSVGLGFEKDFILPGAAFNVEQTVEVSVVDGDVCSAGPGKNVCL